MDIVGRDREKLNELQTDLIGYMLGEVIWRSSENTVVSLVTLLKILVHSLELIFRPVTYDNGNIRLCVMQFEIMYAVLSF